MKKAATFTFLALFGVAGAQSYRGTPLNREVSNDIVMSYSEKGVVYDVFFENRGDGLHNLRKERSKVQFPVPFNKKKANYGKLVKYGGKLLKNGGAIGAGIAVMEMLNDSLAECQADASCSGNLRDMIYGEPIAPDKLPRGDWVIRSVTRCSYYLEEDWKPTGGIINGNPVESKRYAFFYPLIGGGNTSGEGAFFSHKPPHRAPTPINAVHGCVDAKLSQLSETQRQYVQRKMQEKLENPLPYLRPLPNPNQVMDNPYYDVTIDTDGDGWTDSEEATKGSDPSNYNDYPTGKRDYLPRPWTPPVLPPDYPTHGLPLPRASIPASSQQDTTANVNPSPRHYPDLLPPPNPRPIPNPDKDADPKPPEEEQPKPPEEEQPKPPEEEQPEPPEEEQPPKEEDPNNPANPDVCGDMSMKRLMSRPFGWLRDVVIPCDDLQDYLQPMLTMAQTKFPFSVAHGLSGWFDAGGGGGGHSELPSSIAMIPLNWSWATGLWSLIKTLVGAALYIWFGYWILDRFAPRTTI